MDLKVLLMEREILRRNLERIDASERFVKKVMVDKRERLIDLDLII